MNLIILGFAGSGKGTQAELLSRKFKIKVVDGGEYLRKLNLKSVQVIHKGILAPTKIVKNWLKTQITKNARKGLIISGQPRMISEARFVIKLFKEKNILPKVIFLKISEKEAVKRLKKRFICSGCEKIYIFEKQTIKTCEKCGEKIIRRKDDTERGIKNRIKHFKKNVEETLRYFKKLGILIEINGEQSVKNVFKDILMAINKNK